MDGCCGCGDGGAEDAGFLTRGVSGFPVLENFVGGREQENVAHSCV